MSSSLKAPSLSLLRSLKSEKSCTCIRLACQQTRRISSTRIQKQNEPVTPRWAQTPPAMKAPSVRIRARPAQTIQCNDSADKLDAFYTSLLGSNGPSMLADETKWLAVTHKSFDHGRRGFNDRLAYLELQTSIGLMTAASGSTQKRPEVDSYGRAYFRHPATDGLDVLNSKAKDRFLQPRSLANVARQYGLHDVIRWQPKDANDFKSSGVDTVLAQALYAIIGALALEQGGAIANRVARERVLLPAGLMQNGLEGSGIQQMDM